MEKKEIVWLTIIFILACMLRIYLSIQTPYFSDTESYYHLRQTEQLQENPIPQLYDKLSYGGKQTEYSPLFYYLFYLPTKFVDLILAAKIISAILISLLILPIFLISKKLTNNTPASLISAGLSLFIPANTTATLNIYSPTLMIIPLIFLALYYMMDIQKYTIPFITTTIIGAIIHPTFLILILSFITYLALAKITNFKIEKANAEAILFATFLTSWITFITYKNAFLTHGITVIWQNIPQQILRNYFSGISILQMITTVGLIPLIIGAYIIYQQISKTQNKDTYLLISLAITTIILATLHLQEPIISLAFIGIIMIIFFSIFLKTFWNYLENARFKIIRTTLIIILIISLIFTNILPTINIAKNTIKQSEINETVKALEWIKENTKPGDVVAASLKEGNLVTYFAKRPNVIDENFILQTDAAIRLTQLNTLYTIGYTTEAITILNNYNVKYILLTPQTKQQYKIQQLRFIDKNCFKLVYDDQVKVYKSLCKMDKI